MVPGGDPLYHTQEQDCQVSSPSPEVYHLQPRICCRLKVTDMQCISFLRVSCMFVHASRALLFMHWLSAADCSRLSTFTCAGSSTQAGRSKSSIWMRSSGRGTCLSSHSEVLSCGQTSHTLFQWMKACKDWLQIGHSPWHEPMDCLRHLPVHGCKQLLLIPAQAWETFAPSTLLQRAGVRDAFSLFMTPQRA